MESEFRSGPAGASAEASSDACVSASAGSIAARALAAAEAFTPADALTAVCACTMSASLAVAPFSDALDYYSFVCASCRQTCPLLILKRQHELA